MCVSQKLRSSWVPAFVFLAARVETTYIARASSSSSTDTEEVPSCLIVDLVVSVNHGSTCSTVRQHCKIREEVLFYNTLILSKHAERKRQLEHSYH